MKFDIALKDVGVGQRTHRMENSGRCYPCVVCNEITVWRDCLSEDSPGVPVCSDECLDSWDELRKEIHVPIT